MPRQETALIGAPCWIDLFTADAARAETFYGEVLGWTAEHTGPEFGDYVNFHRGGVPVAGMVGHDGTADHPDGWTVYFATTDVKGTAAAAVAAGAQVVAEPAPVGDLGAMAVLVDAGGAPFALWQPGAHQGFGLVAEAGAPAWFELHAREYATSVGFYERALGWRTRVMSDGDDFRYTQMVIDDEPYAGIMDSAGFLPEHVPANWQVYFGTPDVDAAVDTVTRLGGGVIQPAEDTPFGRIAAVSDPTGAVFRLVSAPAS